MVDFVVMPLRQDPPVAWAALRESEGWHGIGVGDHWYMPDIPSLNHPFVALGAMAATTTRVRLTTVFLNNLFRSPVDVALASLTVHAVSSGRFELGLGAGWERDEVIRAGLDYPAPAERARRFFEAVQIVRDLFRGGCGFEGRYYRVDFPAIGPQLPEPPRLTAALGGPWTMRHIGPLVDRIEVAPMGAAFRGGTNDFAALGALSRDELRGMIELAHESNPAAAVGLSVFTAAGSGRGVDYFSGLYDGGAFEGLAGPPEQVGDTLHGLAELGVDRITVMPVLTDPERLAATLYPAG